MTSVDSVQPQRTTGRSVGAIIAALVVGLVLTLGTDAILHVVGFFPAYDQVPLNVSLDVVTW